MITKPLDPKTQRPLLELQTFQSVSWARCIVNDWKRETDPQNMHAIFTQRKGQQLAQSKV
ncbi:hypothetical protein Syun_012577 [Stephania yunnanensis]|uniref:Uncharacterized protein n=1 Tax=Stephania yunnanensis TaxID=152371 RepID=A0AAP0K223_9MAGN